jgi:cell division protein FtsX
MSDQTPLPSMPAPPAADEPPGAAGLPARHRPWLGLVLVGVAGVLIGAAIAATVFLLAGPERAPQNRYEVTVFLGRDVTAEQKAAIGSKLPALHPVDGVRFEDHEQAWKKFQEMFKDDPELVQGASAAALPESFRLATKGTTFDCAALAPVRRLAGAEKITVVQRPSGDRPGAIVGCG